MFTNGLCNHDRGANALHHCQARQQDEPAKDSFFKGGSVSSIHIALLHLPLHGEEVFPELKTDLEREILKYSSAVFERVKEEQQSGALFCIMDATLEGDSGVISGVPGPSHVSADHETEDSDVVLVSTKPPSSCPALTEILIPPQLKKVP